MHDALFEVPADGRPPVPRRRGPDGEGPPGDPPHEPLFNAPGAAVVVAVVIIAGYFLQSRYPLDAVSLSYAFSPALLAEGQWYRLLTYNFLHGGWPHALMNAAFGLAFGAPVARFLGERWPGALIFFGFYLSCGVLAALGTYALHPHSQQVMVGASGAVSGLFGGAARLIAGEGRLGSALSRPVMAMGAAWLIMNLIFALVGGALIPGTGGAGIAWEAHIAGFLAGLVVITPFAWIARRA